MTTLDFDRLDRYIAEGRLIRRAWTGHDADGRETACLLAALYPPCGEERDASACPADLLPEWFTKITPWVDDAGSAERWPGFVRRFAAQVCRQRTPEQWESLRHRWLAVCVREAMRHTTSVDVLAACETVAALHEAEVPPADSRWSAASSVTSWMLSMLRAAKDAASSVTSWMLSMLRAAKDAAAAAVRAADAAAWAADVDAAARAAAEAAAEAAADRIIDGFLVAMEQGR